MGCPPSNAGAIQLTEARPSPAPAVAVVGASIGLILVTKASSPPLPHMPAQAPGIWFTFGKLVDVVMPVR